MRTLSAGLFVSCKQALDSSGQIHDFDAFRRGTVEVPKISLVAGNQRIRFLLDGRRQDRDVLVG